MATDDDNDDDDTVFWRFLSAGPALVPSWVLAGACFGFSGPF